MKEKPHTVHCFGTVFSGFHLFIYLDQACIRQKTSAPLSSKACTCARFCLVSFITGRYLVHITGEQAATDTNLTPLQFTLLSEKLAAAKYENHFLGKGHMGWQTTDHLLINRGFTSHMGYLGGSESYKWGRADSSLDPSALTGKHDSKSRSIAIDGRQWEVGVAGRQQGGRRVAVGQVGRGRGSPEAILSLSFALFPRCRLLCFLCLSLTLLLRSAVWHNDHPGTDIAPLIGYSTSFYAMQVRHATNSFDCNQNIKSKYPVKMAIH